MRCNVDCYLSFVVCVDSRAKAALKYCEMSTCTSVVRHVLEECVAVLNVTLVLPLWLACFACLNLHPSGYSIAGRIPKSTANIDFEYGDGTT